MKTLLFFTTLFTGIFVWSIWVIISHPQNAIVSWDEGFHGGAAFFVSESLRNGLIFSNYSYILNDFINGIIWYPPLWLFIAGPLGALFTPSPNLYRLATLIFAVLSILAVALFVRSLAGGRAGLIAAAVLAFTPVFIVYSHLMMREVPLLFAVSLTIIFFYRYLTKEKLTRFDYVLCVVAFALGVLAKIIGVVLIFGTISIFGLILYLFFRSSREWSRFNSRWTIYFLLTSVGAFLIYRHIVKAVLHADPLFFHLNQTKELSGAQVNLILSMVKTLIDNLTLYLGDFSHMPALTVFWFGSLIAYFILKRSTLSILLIIWVLVTYLSFSIVKPQAQQYLMSIFAPLSLAVGLFWGEFLKYRMALVRNVLFVLIMIAIVWIEFIHLDKTETIGWRTLITNQGTAAYFLAEQAKFGERVISVGDGTRFLIRLAGEKKKLQTLNGAARLCPDSIQDSVEWAITDTGQQNPIELEDINKPNWVKIASFPGYAKETTIWKNTNNTGSFIQDMDRGDPFSKRCARVLLLGKNEFTIYAMPKINNDIADEDDLKVYLRPNLAKIVAELSISQADLKKQDGKEQKYKLILDQKKINQPVFASFLIPKNLKLEIEKIENLHKGD